MSSASDIFAYEHSVEPSASETLFSSKKWTYIQDSTSNTGQYSGQIQLNLASISSQAAFVNWEEAVIEIPVKLHILNGSTGPISSTTAANIDQLIPKAGAWQFIDSVSVVIDGVTVQTNQTHENVNATFKALTEWSAQDLQKYGSTSTFALDKWEPPVMAMPQTLDNVPTPAFMTSTNNIGEYGLSNTYLNTGALERSKFTGLAQSSGNLAFDVMGNSSNISPIGKSQVYVAPAGAVAAGAPFYVAHYIATIKLRDICDYFKKCPMQKNVSGYIYINYNSSNTTLTTGASSAIAVSPGNLANISNNMLFGNTCPVLYNFASATASAALSGTSWTPTGLTVPATTVLNITADVNGTPASAGGLTPSQSFTRLLVPTYTPNPSADHALSQRKTFRYFERMTNKFTVAAGQSFTYTLTNGVANPRKLFLQPIITNPTAGATAADVINPFRSPFSTVPATCSPFASIKQLQVTVGNLPMFNNPVNFGYDMYVQEMAKSGVDGGLDDPTSAGLLSQQLWESLYRFVPIDIGRRLPSEDGASKSIIVSGTNNTKYTLTVYYHVWRDVIASTDTSMGTFTQGAVQH
ncbi:hypothetical protein BBJ28_00022872 [Nothophytophthora sp. Chile5]|nr:hypothetical protein BBJ28_00022872 [Nothophytophthora sp. Chile5]